MCESEARKTGAMGHYKLGPLRPVMMDPNLTLVKPRARQHRRTRLVRDLTQPFRVVYGHYLIQKLQIDEIVDEYLVEKNDDDSVAPELDRFDLGAKQELADAAGLAVVPHHDLVGRGERVGSASDYGEVVAVEEHLDESDAAAWAEVVAEGIAVASAEGVAGVDAEAGVGAGGEAGVVLVESEVEEGGGFGRACGFCGD